VAQKPKSGPGRLILDVSGSHTHKHLDAHPAGLLWTSDQLFAQSATYATHSNRKKRTSMPSAGFEPATPAIKRLQD